MALTLPAPDLAAAGLLLVLYRSEGLSISLATRMCPAFTASQAHAALEVFVTAGLATLVEGEHRDVYMPLMDDAPARREYARLSGARACRSCGCTDLWACDGGCHWVETDLCSGCPPTPLSAEGRTQLLAAPEASLQASIPAQFGDRVEIHCDSPELIGLQLHVHDASLWVLLDPKQAAQVAAPLQRLASSDPAPAQLTRDGLEQLLADVQAAQARVEASRHLHRNQASGILGAFAGAIRDVLSGALPVVTELDGPQ